MATWQEVRDRLRSEFAVDADGDDEIAVTIPRRHGEQHRAQRVMVRPYVAWGTEMLEIRSAFGEAGDLDPEETLSDNLTIPLGFIAQHGKFLLVVHKTPLADLSADTVVFLATRISLLADALEERLGSDRF